MAAFCVPAPAARGEDAVSTDMGVCVIDEGAQKVLDGHGSTGLRSSSSPADSAGGSRDAGGKDTGYRADQGPSLACIRHLPSSSLEIRFALVKGDPEEPTDTGRL